MIASRFMRAAVPGFGAALLLLTCPATARADAGVPMLALMAVPMWASLLAIIPLEAFIATRRLGLAWSRSLKVSAIANLVSTVAGVPLTWILLAVVEMALTYLGGALAPHGRPYPPLPLGEAGEQALALIVTSPWLNPDESRLYWMMPAAALLLCVPFFFASVWIEYRVARRMMGRDQAPRVLGWAWRANVTSYVLLALVPAAWLGHNLVQHHKTANDEAHRSVDLVPAERLWELAVARANRPVAKPRGSQYPGGEHGLADSLWLAGLDAHESGDDRSAESRWRATLAELDRAEAAADSSRANTTVSRETILGLLASLCSDQARYADAIPLYERLVAANDARAGSQWHYLSYPRGLVAAYDSTGQPDRAEDYCQHVLDREKWLIEGNPDALAWAWSDRASHRLARGDSALAEAFYLKAIALEVTAAVSSAWPEDTQAHHGLTALYRRQRRLPEAEALLAAGIERYSSRYGGGEFPDSSGAGPLFLDLGLVYLDQGALPQAMHCIRSALRWDRDSRLHDTAEAYAQLLERQGRPAESKAWRARANTVRR
jgi:tetratricopeptide (TPR) repeat protein